MWGPVRLGTGFGISDFSNSYSEYNDKLLMPSAEAEKDKFIATYLASGGSIGSSGIRLDEQKGGPASYLELGILVRSNLGVGLRLEVVPSNHSEASPVVLASNGYWYGHYVAHMSYVSVMPGLWLEGGRDGRTGLDYRAGFYAGPAMLMVGMDYGSEWDKGSYEYSTASDGIGYAAKLALGCDYWLTDWMALTLDAGWRLSSISKVKYSKDADTNGDGVFEIKSGDDVTGLNGEAIGYDYGGWSVAGGLTFAFGNPRRPAPVKTGVRRLPATARREGERTNIAVGSLEPQGVSTSDAAVISDMLRNELIKTKAFNVVEKQNMDKILAEHAFQQTGCTSEDCAVKLGRILNVQKMVMGSFGKLMGNYFISVRVVDVETGNADFSEDARGQDLEQISDGVKKIATGIAVEVR